MLGFSPISSGPLSSSGEGEQGGTAAGVTLTGTSIFVPGLADGGATAAGVVLTGLGTFLSGTATGGVAASAPGATWLGTSSWSPGLAVGDQIYTRAPSGGGYSPRRNEASSRPAATQRNSR